MLPCIRLLWVAAFVSGLFGGVSSAQEDEVPVSVKVTQTADGQLFIGADPNVPLDRYQQLGDRQIREALGLSTESYDVYREFELDFRKEYSNAWVDVRAGKRSKKSTREMLDKHVEEACRLFDEMLSPEQQQRLDEILYRLEIKRVGLTESITSGRLSYAVGVHDNQRTFIREYAERVEKETEKQIRQLREQAIRKVLGQLAPEQRDRGIELIGEPVHYQLMTNAQKTYQKIKRQLIESEAAADGRGEDVAISGTN